jgi:hypothetical protein
MASATRQNDTPAMNRQRRTRRRTARDVRRGVADHEPLLEDCYVRAARIGPGPSGAQPDISTHYFAANSASRFIAGIGSCPVVAGTAAGHTAPVTSSTV